MLKSTHRPLALPAPWSEHRAPSGHTYYYNRETKESTYTRPSAPAPPAQPPTSSAQSLFAPPFYAPNVQPDPQFHARFGSVPVWSGNGHDGRQQHPQHHHRHQRPYQHRQPLDRPRTKHTIPGQKSWILVKTKLGRRFVHNLDTLESFWKVPEDLIPALVEFDISEREERERLEKLGDQVDTGIGKASTDKLSAEGDGQSVVSKQRTGDEEENDNSDDEEYGNEASGRESPPGTYKRRKVELEAVGGDGPADGNVAPEADEAEDHAQGDEDGGEEEDEENYMLYDDESPQPSPPPQESAHEFGEEEMAAQLAAMGEAYDLDPSEYYAADEAYEGGADEDLAQGLTEEECIASFQDMLNDHAINPFATWDSVIDANSASSEIISDSRYTLLPNMRSRKDAFANWSSERISALKAQREQQVKQNPRIPFLALLASHATPKLYWAEFKRKWKREPEMRDSKLNDKDREKLYRDYISRITKMTDDARSDELAALMRTLPPSRTWNRSSSVDGLMPEALLADIRFASVKASERERAVIAFVRSLPTADEVAVDGNDGETTAEESQRRREREKREEAMRRRADQVEMAKRTQQKDLLRGQRELRHEERQLEMASRVDKNGLKQNLDTI